MGLCSIVCFFVGIEKKEREKERKGENDGSCQGRFSAFSLCRPFVSPHPLSNRHHTTQRTVGKVLLEGRQAVVPVHGHRQRIADENAVETRRGAFAKDGHSPGWRKKERRSGGEQQEKRECTRRSAAHKRAGERGWGLMISWATEGFRSSASLCLTVPHCASLRLTAPHCASLLSATRGFRFHVRYNNKIACKYVLAQKCCQHAGVISTTAQWPASSSPHSTAQPSTT